MNCYDTFANYYDDLMTDCDYENWSQYLLLLIKKVTNNTNCIDLACGSGKHTILLKKAGYNVLGADISPKMLQIANINAKKAYENIQFIVQDLQKLDIQKKFDVITCVCDGYNYVSQLKIFAAFSSVFNILNNGGIFTFDLSSEYKLTKVLSNNIFYEDNENLTYFWQNSLDKSKTKVNMELNFFVKNNSGLYERFDEYHTQYVHKTQEVIENLKRCGFSDIKAYDFLTEENFKTNSQRIQFVATK